MAAGKKRAQEGSKGKSKQDVTILKPSKNTAGGGRKLSAGSNSTLSAAPARAGAAHEHEASAQLCVPDKDWSEAGDLPVPSDAEIEAQVLARIRALHTGQPQQLDGVRAARNVKYAACCLLGDLGQCTTCCKHATPHEQLRNSC